MPNLRKKKKPREKKTEQRYIKKKENNITPIYVRKRNTLSAYELPLFLGNTLYKENILPCIL